MMASLVPPMSTNIVKSAFNLIHYRFVANDVKQYSTRWIIIRSIDIKTFTGRIAVREGGYVQHLPANIVQQLLRAEVSLTN